MVDRSSRTFTFDPREADVNGKTLYGYTGELHLRCIAGYLMPDGYLNPSCHNFAMPHEKFYVADYDLDIVPDPTLFPLGVYTLQPQSVNNFTYPPSVCNPTLTGVVRGNFHGAAMQVQFDLNGDGQPDGSVNVTASGQSFTFDPRTADSSYVNFQAAAAETLRYRVVPLDDQGKPVGSPNWTSYTYVLAKSPDPTLRVGAFGPQKSIMSGGIVTATDPTVTGSVVVADGGSPAAGSSVQIDGNGDGLPDAALTADGNGQFTWKPDRPQYGTITVAARTVEWNDLQKMQVFGRWDTIQFDFIPPPMPAVTEFKLDGSTGQGGTPTTSNAELSGRVASGCDLSNVSMQFDLGGDGKVHGTATLNADGTFQYQPTGVGSSTVSICTAPSGPTPTTRNRTTAPGPVR